MSVELRVILLVAAIFSIVWIITRIQKAKVRLEDTFFWVATSVILLVLGLFPRVSYWLASVLGIISPANLLFLIMICLLFEKLLTISILHSQLEDKYVTMAAEMALRCKELERQIEDLRELTENQGEM
ncbi:MAG: DUF2304 domain-containing protein [Lachnospiraceae bacterium]|nr:DUF2304 domain-containing protein [Lachnospiraceae bacterium]